MCGSLEIDKISVRKGIIKQTDWIDTKSIMIRTHQIINCNLCRPGQYTFPFSHFCSSDFQQSHGNWTQSLKELKIG